MNLKVKEGFIDSNIHQPYTGKIVNIKFNIDPADYEFYYNNGYEHLFDVEEPVNEIEVTPTETPTEETTNDIPEPEQQ